MSYNTKIYSSNELNMHLTLPYGEGELPPSTEASNGYYYAPAPNSRGH